MEEIGDRQGTEEIDISISTDVLEVLTLNAEEARDAMTQGELDDFKRLF